MAETLAYNFVGNDELSRVFEVLDRVATKLERTFDQLGDNASQAGRRMGTAGHEAKGLGEKLRETGEDADKAGRKVDDFGDETTKAAAKAQFFDLEIKRLKGDLRDLGAEFERTGNLDVLKRFRSTQSDLGLVTRVRKEFEAVKQETDRTATEVSTGFWGKIFSFGGKTFTGDSIPALLGRQGSLGATAFGEGFMGALKPFAGPAAIVFGVPLVATLLTMVSGALLGATGLAAIAGGVAVQFSDPRVKAAVSDLGAHLKGELVNATSGFVGNFTNGVTALKREMSPLWADLQRGFHALEPYVANLLVKLGQGLAQLGPGLSRGLEAAGPVIGAIAKNLPMLLGSIGGFFERLAAGGKGATQAIDLLFHSFAIGITVMGNVLLGASKVFSFLISASDTVTGIMAKIPGIGEAWKPAHDYVHGIATSFDESSLSADGFAGSLDGAGAAAGRFSGLAAQVGSAAQTAGLGARIAKVDFGTLSSAISATESTTDMLAGQMTDRLMGSMLGVSHATLDVNNSLLGMKDVVAQNGLAIDRHTGLVAANTKEGIGNRNAVLSMIESNLHMYDAQIATGVAADVATKKYEDNTKALHDQLRAAGYTEAQVHDLIGEYGSVPGKVNTEIAAKGLTNAIEDLNELLRKLNHLDGRVATMTVQEIHRTTYTTDTAPSGYFRGLAYGGRAGKRAMGGVYDVGENGPERVVLPDDAYVIPNNQMSRGAGPEVLDAVDVPINFRDPVTGEVVQEVLLRLARQRGYKTVAQLLPVGA